MSERPLPVVPAWRWWSGLGVVAAGAGYLSAMAYREGLPNVFQLVPQFDKVVHFTTAGLLAFFLDGASATEGLRHRRACGLARRAGDRRPAGIEEYLQRYSVYRTSSIWDFVADLLGVLVFLPLSRRVARVE